MAQPQVAPTCLRLPTPPPPTIPPPCRVTLISSSSSLHSLPLSAPSYCHRRRAALASPPPSPAPVERRSVPLLCLKYDW
ncbi:hypothetical protein GUJ93_ZPchr0013g35143 [Zizania palustris]|uniref:Uncharacterized protein n=1 Tax=Zizania palustris TaxID=103762 RepID=A0A8J6BZU6_ZIZPA|nr:hypothetical protein GUJ93_ZPchr0013g35143 [Zizania palustris]